MVAYIDEDLPLGRGRYLMAPMVAARLLQAAAIERTDTALIIGAGTGYEAALAAMLARNVVAVEEDPELARRARAALVEHAIASVNVVEGPLPQGYRQRAPYDVILFGGAVAEVPSEIDSQLAEEAGSSPSSNRRTVSAAPSLRQGLAGCWSRGSVRRCHPLLPGFLPKPAFVF